MIKLIKVSFLNIFRRKNRTILALLGIIIGIASLVILVSVVDGIYKETSDTIGKLQGIIVYKKDAISPVFDTINTSYENKLKSIAGIKKVIPEVVKLIGTIDKKQTTFGGPTNSYNIVGIAPEDAKYSLDAEALDNIIKGQALKSSDSKQILIPKKIADDYVKVPGSKIDLDGEKFTIKGVFESKTSKEESTIFGTLEDVKDVFNIPQDRVTMFIVVPLNPDDAKRISDLIEFKYPELQAMGQQELVDQVGSIVNNLKILVIIISIIAAIVAGIGVINTMLMSVMERTKEIGTLKAVGWTKEEIIIMIVFESTFIGIIGGILGILLGYMGSFFLGYYAPTYIYLSLIIESFLFAVALGFIGGFYPAWIAAKLDPIEALRSE